MKDVEDIFDVLQAHGVNEIDTATMYTQGTSERLLGETDYKERGLLVGSKLYPLGVSYL